MTAPPVGTPHRPFHAARRLWSEIQWPVVSVLAVTSVVLGYVGWAQQLRGAGIPATPIDPLYLSIQLFTLQVSGVPDATGFPPALQVARFLAPGLAGYAALGLFLKAFGQTRQRLAVRVASDHVVICGLGSVGLRLAQHLRATGRSVVAVDPGPDAVSLAAAREAGVWVIDGDARDPRLLGSMRLKRASHVIAVCGDDATNGEVALAVAEVTADAGTTPLDCRVHVDDAGLSARLRTHEVAAGSPPGMTLDYFNVHEAAARTMFVRFPPFDPHRPEATPGVVVVGDGPFAQAVLTELARLWSVAAGTDRLRVLLLERSGADTAGTIGRTHPGLLDRFALEVEELDPYAERFTRLAVAARTAPGYVCLADEVEGLAAATALTSHRRPADPPIVVRANRDRGLAELMTERHPVDTGRIVGFGMLDAACDPAVLLSGLWERLAIAAHESYVAAALERGQTVEDNPALVPWSDLPETLRAANRGQASHLGDKLSAIGARAVPLIAPVDDASLSPEELERLAEMEHERWCSERRADGWILGDKDHAAKTTPYLVGWDDLDEDTRELDRDAVRDIPRLLALTGHRIGRTKR